MKSFNATPNSLSTLYVSKKPYSKGKYPKFNQHYSQPFKGKKKPIFSNLNNYDLYITKKKIVFDARNGSWHKGWQNTRQMQCNPT